MKKDFMVCSFGFTWLHNVFKKESGEKQEAVEGGKLNR
jgi:hypothetical protein